MVQITFNNGNNSAIVAPAGWTLLRRDDEGGSLGQAVYYRVTTGLSETASYTWTVTGNASTTALALLYRGADPANPIDAHVGASANSNTLTAPVLTTTASNGLLLVLFGHDTSAATLTPQTPLVIRAAANTARTSMATELQLTTPGSTGPWSADCTDVNQWVAQAVALRPAP